MTKRLEERNGLVSGMAGLCGADVAEAFRQGVIGPRQYREFLDRCSQCKATEACETLLAETDAPLPEAPDYCRNRAEIQGLKERLTRALT